MIDFDKMTDKNKLNHIYNLMLESKEIVFKETILADILDFWSYWMPWLFEYIGKLKTQNEELLKFVEMVRKSPCDPIDQDNCLACDAKKLMDELGGL